MRKVITIIALELYAIALAVIQFLNGVHTDEAKYLLNIPYPHPPLARFILHLLDGFAYQEFFWRLVFASLCVQAVWLVVRLLKGVSASVIVAVCCCWLFSTAVVLQAGTIMMAPLTALEAWLFAYLWMQEESHHKNPGFLALLWLACLFTAYQAILFAPLVSALICRHTTRFWHRTAYIVLPVFLLVLYTLTNPLVPASILVHSGDALTSSTRFTQLLMVWFLGGSVVLSVAGLFGMIRYRMWPFLLSFMLVGAYVFLAQYDYYAILFLPLSMVGLIALVRQRAIVAWPLAGGVLLMTFYHCFIATSLLHPAGPARLVMQELASEHVKGIVLMQGTFGHDWQYESTLPVLRYTPTLLPKAGAVLCTGPCTLLDTDPAWRQITSPLPRVYIRRTP